MNSVRGPILRLALLITPALCCSLATENATDVETIVEKSRRVAEQQKSELCTYSVHRTYVLSNKHLSREAKMFFLVTYDKAGGKKFQLQSEENTNTFIRHSILDLIDGEIASAGRDSDKSELNDHNYKFKLLGEEKVASRHCFKIRIEPRLRNKYLLDGYIWIDSTQFTLVKLEGQPAKSVSFWVSHSNFEQDFAPVQSFWLPSYNHSAAHITFFGEVSLTIQYDAYHVEACQIQPATAMNGSPDH